RVLASVEPDVERPFADRQAIEVLAIEALAERVVVDARQASDSRYEIVMSLHRIGGEISNPHRVLGRGQLHRQYAIGVARIVDSDPLLAIEAHDAFIIGPTVRIGGAGAIGDAQSDLAARRP